MAVTGVEILEGRGAFLLDGYLVVEDGPEAQDIITGRMGAPMERERARRNTIAWEILSKHNTNEGEDRDEALKIRFDKLTSHDITFVGIIQTARASGLTRFPMPYVLTNCHNSLCAVGGTINEDDHVFGLSAARKYGGIYVPPHQAVIHQFAREMLATCGGMILGSDSHTRYGALGTMAVGEGGPELVKQLLLQTWDVKRPEVIAVYLEGEPVRGVGPQDVALSIIGSVFENGYVKNKVMEFVGPGVEKLSADFRIGVDVMTTETTCLSSIWQTDEEIRDFYEIHGRSGDFRELAPGDVAYYDGLVRVNLSEIRPMIAMPFHPSNVYSIGEVNETPEEILADVEKRARVSFGDRVQFSLRDKVRGGRLCVEQGIIAGCAGGGFENICAAADILKGRDIGADAFTLSVYPASVPIYMELVKNGAAATLLETGAIIKTAFCGPCFGAGDTPANGALSIRHSTRNFPNREGSKIQNGQIASVALMDARSIAATAANRGVLTPATEFDGTLGKWKYHFDADIYRKRVFDSHGQADPDEELVLGPNIRDWPRMPALPDNLLLRVVSVIHDPVTTTDELIPSGETSSYRSNPEGLAEFTLSRKDPAYVGLAREIRIAEQALLDGGDAAGAENASGLPLTGVLTAAEQAVTDIDIRNIGFGSVIFAVKPGDGSAREQAASCQKVLGGWANIAREYATKRYRSNLINWGMLPFILPAEEESLPFEKLDYIFLPAIRSAVKEKQERIRAFAVSVDENGTVGRAREFSLRMQELTDDERKILLEGCLINYNNALLRSMR